MKHFSRGTASNGCLTVFARSDLNLAHDLTEGQS